MSDFYKYIYCYILIWRVDIKNLCVCSSIDPNVPPDPPVMARAYFKQSADGSSLIGMYDDVYLDCSLTDYFKR